MQPRLIIPALFARTREGNSELKVDSGGGVGRFLRRYGKYIQRTGDCERPSVINSAQRQGQPNNKRDLGT